jgi:hypothetical protein
MTRYQNDPQFTTAVRLASHPAPFSFALHFRPQGLVPAARRGYRGGNTTEGAIRPLCLITGTYNTAVGLFSTVRSLAVGAGRDERLLSIFRRKVCGMTGRNGRGR